MHIKTKFMLLREEFKRAANDGERDLNSFDQDGLIVARSMVRNYNGILNSAILLIDELKYYHIDRK